MQYFAITKWKVSYFFICRASYPCTKQGCSETRDHDPHTVNSEFPQKRRKYRGYHCAHPVHYRMSELGSGGDFPVWSCGMAVWRTGFPVQQTGLHHCRPCRSLVHFFSVSEKRLSWRRVKCGSKMICTPNTGHPVTGVHIKTLPLFIRNYTG